VGKSRSSTEEGEGEKRRVTAALSQKFSPPERREETRMERKKPHHHLPPAISLFVPFLQLNKN
jgi:hypothetical protein